MYRGFRIALTLAVAVLIAGPALAQQRGQGRGRGGIGGFMGGGSLLSNPAVQKELKLSDEQIKKVKEVTEEVRAKHKDDYAKLRDAEPAERFQKGRELGQAVAAEIEKGMQSDLKPEQQKRLAQIKLQQKGVRAFEDADVQKALNLTADQKDTLKTINEDLQKDQRELFGGGRGAGAGAGGGRRGGGRGQFNPETFKKMAAVQKEAMDKAVATLNDNQKKQWKEMTGEPFTMTPAFGGGRRGNRQ